MAENLSRPQWVKPHNDTNADSLLEGKLSCLRKQQKELIHVIFIIDNLHYISFVADEIYEREDYKLCVS